ncbi:M67 family metallopeptidase [Sandaracinobacter neustonicus]|uniref:M67 family metallopeptidase n=1 Tax=Sandaracinobacter neustonicus TaxID=1715348 RepID=A0A501XPC0_9SPHN|nr:M67 family metallopeptidase [Sandaracinobacter neustonicus]TPE62446.1 M67 family metallopeptidase [Sandaracinobacter neustonicus]
MDLGCNSRGSSPLLLDHRAAAAIRAAVRQSGHNEACGLLLGTPGHITEATVARNISPEPARRFEIDPAHLFDIHRRARAGPLAILGCWHSHPNGNPRPSRHDRDGVADESWLWLIAAGEDLSLWRPIEGGFAPVAFAVAAL